jgi:CTP synthase
VEFVELDRALHPYFVATQAHPELKSRPTRPHPLFAGLVGAAVAYAAQDRLPMELPAPVDAASNNGARAAAEVKG